MSSPKSFLFPLSMALDRISNGSTPKPGMSRSTVPERATCGARVGAWLLATGALLTSLATPAVTQIEPQLLEPERAFSLSARGLDPKTIEARFTIAEGY